MSIGKALGTALAITLISIVLLTITRGIPTSQQVWQNGSEMFVVAFVVLKFFTKS